MKRFAKWCKMLQPYRWYYVALLGVSITATFFNPSITSLAICVLIAGFCFVGFYTRLRQLYYKRFPKCVWNLGTPCNGKVSCRGLFADQIVIPICEQHFEEHKKLMALYSGGVDIESLLGMGSNERNNAFDSLPEDIKEDAPL